MIKSNINITSNIYIRSNSELREDSGYVSKITGAKKIKEIQERYIGFEAIPLTEIQQKIASENTACAYAKNGEMSYGAVRHNDILTWENRCEVTDCPRYEICVSNRRLKTIARNTPVSDDVEEQENLEKFIASLHIKIQEDTIIFERDKNSAKKNETEETVKAYAEPTEHSASEIQELNSQYIKITEPDSIIQSPLDSRIILNSGPGTGKTYTIIQRLIFILANALCHADEIYILCYTRSAKKVIETQIEEAVSKGILKPSAKNICIFTFDSYAGYFLMAMKEQNIITEDFSGYDYNSRIKLFNQYASAEDFETIQYFIIDEIQDLVNERAEMVLHILKYLKCGYLLAGDRCQSIYDYEADEDAMMDSVKFYELLEQQFPPEIQRYEITGNKRQISALAEQADNMRNILLNDSFLAQNQCAQNVMKQYAENIKIETYIRNLTEMPASSTAILCRSNGEAEYISTLLCERKIPHILNRGVNHTAVLPRWIAEVFWDACLESISKEEFMERFCFRCHSSLNPEEIWNWFCKITNTQNSVVLDISKLITALTFVNNMPSDFYDEIPLLTVSTIHKAKGSEFDRVILINSDITPSDSSAEEARIRYVALTRPRNQLVTMKKNIRYFKRTISGRIIETGLHNIYKSSNRFCKCITIGLTGDIDNTAFVSGDFEAVLDLQEYIIHNVHLYDKLTAKRSLLTKNYEIFHNNRCIGSFSKQMLNELDLGLQAVDYKNRLPDRLENIYVSSITTELLRTFSSHVPAEFQKSRICFGIQVTGLAKLIFEKK